jgi:hypothetical protein
VHFHRAQVRGGVAGLPPARMAAVVIVLVIGRWRDIVFLTKNPN